MAALTTRQRDLLKVLLRKTAPVGSADLAVDLHLTHRQVTYDLKQLRQWLAQKEVELRATPGVGVDLVCSPEQQAQLTRELQAQPAYQLVLPASQRQPLLAFGLLMATRPFILYELQKQAQVSRTTVLKDLDELDTWLKEHRLSVMRKPNVGVWIEGPEAGKRQAVSRLLWGQDTPGDPLVNLTHTDGLTFTLVSDKDLLPLAKQAYVHFRAWDMRKSANVVTQAEAKLGGRFSDDAVLYLALAFVVQATRVRAGALLDVDPRTQAWLQALPVWPVASQAAERLAWYWPATWPESEIAGVAMHLLAAPRNERWPSDMSIDGGFDALIDEIMQHIESSYGLPGLNQDITLHDGIVNHVIPACLRRRFDIWMPSLPPGTALPAGYAVEYNVARQLVELVATRTSVVLSPDETASLALILRAAYVRERPRRVQEVIVVCPSGMATAQLLVARLRAHFPRLGNFRVISMRELDRQVLNAPLIITTVPLPASSAIKADVIQVHPLLLPEDIERITQWLG